MGLFGHPNISNDFCGCCKYGFVEDVTQLAQAPCGPFRQGEFSRLPQSGLPAMVVFSCLSSWFLHAKSMKLRKGLVRLARCFSACSHKLWRRTENSPCGFLRRCSVSLGPGRTSPLDTGFHPWVSGSGWWYVTSWSIWDKEPGPWIARGAVCCCKDLPEFPGAQNLQNHCRSHLSGLSLCRSSLRQQWQYACESCDILFSTQIQHIQRWMIAKLR